MIIGRELMIQLGLKSDFGSQILEWDETVIPMKYLGIFLFQTDLTNRDIQDMVMQYTELDSTKKSTAIVTKIINSTYAKSDLDKVAAAAVCLYKNQRKKLLSLLT